MSLPQLLSAATGELALFAGVGFFLFAIDDLAVDLIYFTRTFWRSATVYRHFPRAFADRLPPPTGRIAVLVPAWDESAVIAPMLRAALARFDHPDYRLYVGHYRNDPATAAAIASVADPRVRAIDIGVDGPTTKADCLNRLYAAMTADEVADAHRFKAVVLHDAEDVVDPLELRLFDRLVERAAVVQLPVVPLLDPGSRWVAGHYADEFAEAHVKELVVREAVGAAIPLAGVGCGLERGALDRLAARHDGRPFADASMTEDYEMGLRLGALGLKTMFVRMAAGTGGGAVVASRGHFPTTMGAAVRQKARWIGGIAMSGWDRLGWTGGLGERWFRMRDRRGPMAAVLLAVGYLAALLWGQLALARALGAPVGFTPSPGLRLLLLANAVLLAWHVAMRMIFTAYAYGLGEGLRALPRLLVGNVIAIAASWRAARLHFGGGPRQWDKTAHTFPRELPAMGRS
ncbi:glycosyl transferase family protein [Sphingomonas sp. ASV193]|uniref:glycosyl transferase family protein n=1 Tax=Sphingomonas sp. ASV193 TaxID=3144405 RepID=UPI0032E8FC1F